MIDWNDFAKDVHQTAVDKGWWDKPVSFDDVICMCICELAEAVEEYRSGRPNLYHLCVASGDKRNPCDWDRGMPCPLATGELTCEHRDPKPEGVAVELADCVLRLLDYLVATVKEPMLPFEAIAISGSFIKVICDLHGNLADARNCHYLGKCSSAEGYLHLCIEIIFGWAAQEGVDLEAILRSKHEYNKTRPYRHGGKVL